MRRIGIAVVLLVIALAGLPAGVQAEGADEGLVAEWHFDEGSGSVLADSSGNGNDGVIYGATWVEGKYGGALRFDGVDDYVDVPHSPSLDITDTITIELWVEPTSTPSKYQNIISKGDPPLHSKQAPWQLTINNKNNLDAYRLKNDNYEAEYNICDLSLNSWTMVTVTFDRGVRKIKVYKDGEFIKEWDKTSAIYSDDVDVTIGAQTYNGVICDGFNFNGAIDEVRIYNSALTADEIESHYEGKQTALSLTKSASPHSIKQGQTTTVTLTVKNTGTTEITDIEVSDTIPLDMTFVDGETSKTYASLKPKDSREFQYVLQPSDAGTFNLDPATATYSDEEGNYHTAKSKTAAITVIPSTDQPPTPHTTKKPATGISTASVHLHGEKTDVVLGEDVLLKLSAVNIIGNPLMHVQVIIIPPSGWSVTSSAFAKTGAGQYTTTYDIESGVGRNIEVRIVPNQIGDDFQVQGRIIYYFGDDSDAREDHTLTLPITVRAGADAGAEQTAGMSESGGSSTPGFGAVVAVIGLFAVYLRRRI